jgi:type I restriction enzyme S subunit
MSKCRQHPNDLIETQIGKIPGDWDLSKLSNVAQVIVSNVDKKFEGDESPVFLCNYLDVYQNEYITSNLEFMRGSASEEEIDKFSLRRGDVLVTKDSETAEDIASAAVLADEIQNLICGYHLAILRPDKERIDSYFLAKTLQNNRVHNQFVTKANGVTRYGLTLSVINNATIPVPPLIEQAEIARILSTWDRAIERVQQLIEAKQRQKIKLVSQLLSGQKRFPGFQDEWQQVKLSSFLHPKFRKVVKPAGAYLRLGIRSHGKGTFTSVVDDPETIALTHLFQARKDDLIVNITFAWEGAIALVGPDGDGALVSHRFPTYVFDTSKMLPEYFKYLMVTDRFFYELDLISPGGAGRNRVMNKGDFLKIMVTIPGVEEQKKIASILGEIDEQIDLLNKYLERLKEQKKGLMQKLLTGEIRVKVY